MPRNRQEDVEKTGEDLLAGLGRFSEPALFILVSLADGPKHGYAMTQDIESVSGQKLGAGTLYGAIARLEARKWIEALPAEDRPATVSAHDGGPARAPAPARASARGRPRGPGETGGGENGGVERVTMPTPELLLRLTSARLAAPLWRRVPRHRRRRPRSTSSRCPIDIVMGAIDAWLSLDVRRAASSYSTATSGEDRPCSSP